ncbi:DUF2155 domain-containing protein [Rhodopseudomonas sp. HC1]|uniref:DUF2155 domain-containing protein n=1 Tax=Rhodopseudomonas infernalis TaxID=2897386 RepID=UPI001EE7F52A|nr:DUF2155 domain-containing protein [Rhodopseudomonas infernalis]MCG6203499.1 DUF2155 domain-containing protein [Rhodopseudomonas infernalis]
MSRSLCLVGLAALIAAPLIASALPARAQIGNIFSDPAPRPPGAIPRGGPQMDDEEEVPDLPPQGRVLPAPTRPPQGSALPGPVQSQPLPPPPGTTILPQSPPATANVPPAAPQPGAPAQPNNGVATAPPGANPAPGAPGQRPQRGAPPAPATLQPGDEIVTEPPAQKIVNKKASFTGLDKITGRTINFDADIGETVQFGALRVKTDACYTRPSTEAANTDAFVEVDEITLQGEVKRIFSGWMFAASPGLHAVEHPIYDIWLTDCKNPESPVATAQPDAPKPAAQQPQRRRQPPRQTQQAPPPPLPTFR